MLLAPCTFTLLALTGHSFNAPMDPLRETSAPRRAGELVFAPSRPRAGQRVQVTYQAPADLGRDSVLVLRAVVRSYREIVATWPRPEVVDAARLRRGGDGRYRGVFVLPVDADYARFAVGSADTLRADGNSGHHWTILAHGSDARPTLEALGTAAWDEMQRNEWSAALDLATRATTLYPTRIETWFHRQAIERGVVGEGPFSRRRPEYAKRFQSLDSAFRKPGARSTGTDVGTLYWFAATLGDTTAARRWRSRLIREYPLHPLAVQEQMDDLATTFRGRAGERLDTLEVLFASIGPIHPALLRSGMAAARGAKDTLALRRWVERAFRAGILDDADAANALARLPALAPAALQALHDALEALERRTGNRLEDVDATLVNAGRQDAERRRELLAAAARVSLAIADSSAALQYYVQAASRAWAPDVFRAARALAHARGDASVERQMAALLVADPMSVGATRDSIRAADPTLAADSAWATYLADGERGMIQRIALDPPQGEAPNSIRLTSEGQGSLSLPSPGRGRPTVIALWSMACPYSAPHLPALARIAGVLGERGIDLLVATRDEPSRDLTDFIAAQSAAPRVYHDPGNTVGRQFAAYGYPWFFVLDANGRLRARGHDITVVAAQAVATALATTP